MIYLDAMIVKVKDGGHTRNKAAHIAVGVDMAGIKHVLGIWVQQNEGASFWASVGVDMANRGIKDVLVVCCDGLSGFPEAIAATWSQAAVQTCVVHLIRNALRFVSYADRKAVAGALKPVYTAPKAEAARIELDAFAASELGRKNPNVTRAFDRVWDQFIPFLAFPPEVRRVIYTTNSIVIYRASGAVLHVDHEDLLGSVLLAGRGYLQRSMKQILESRRVCCEGGFLRLAA